jgi:hypothetical protein
MHVPLSTADFCPGTRLERPAFGRAFRSSGDGAVTVVVGDRALVTIAGGPVKLVGATAPDALGEITLRFIDGCQSLLDR